MKPLTKKCDHEYYEYANYRALILYNDYSWRPFQIGDIIKDDEQFTYAEVQVLMCRKCLEESAAWTRLSYEEQI